MKLVHLSDLHLGKRVYDFSMLEDQQYILDAVIRVVETEKPDAVLIAGDVYDRSVPSEEAVALFDSFLVRLAQKNCPVFITSGNHDSPERLSFGSRILDRSGVYIAPVYKGDVKPVELQDGNGPVRVYMLPFVKPANVRACLEGEEIQTYTDAVAAAVRHMNVDTSVRNVLVAHQYVTGAMRSESEEMPVGGLDNVDASAFEPFDYVALGHLHGPQNPAARIRYCGSPLKYSFSEADQQKSVTVVELGAKGSDPVIRTVDLVPRRDLVEIRGRYAELTALSYYAGKDFKDAYLHVTLTDEEDEYDAIGKLRVIYPNLMKLDYDNTRTRTDRTIDEGPAGDVRTPAELFADFYEQQNNRGLNDVQKKYMDDLIEKTWERNDETD